MFFTASHRRGVLVLITLFSCYILAHLFVNNQGLELKPLVIIEDNHSLDSNYGEVEILDSIILNQNPNLWAKEDWIYLGFSENQVKVILNYKDKIGGFKNRKQLSSCYAINQTAIEKLDSIIVFPEIVKTYDELLEVFKILESSEPNYNLIKYFDTIYFQTIERKFLYYLTYNNKNLNLFSKSRHDSLYDLNRELKKHSDLKILFKRHKSLLTSKVNINTADSLVWLKIKGIGPKTTRQILSFRKNLGGFLAKDQLKEVYLISDSLYKTFENQLFNDSQILKININNVSISDLKKHPYINWNLANAIVNYRIQHGDFFSVDKIKEIHLVNDEIYRKIAPYLKIR